MIQTIINYVYRYPKATVKRYQRFGGYRQYMKMEQGRKQMEQASLNLSPVVSFADGLPIYFLTGKKYLYQTLFCIQSLSKASTTSFKYVLVDDGSFDESLIKRIRQQLPHAEVITKQQIDQNLEELLPRAQYPNIHHKRAVYPHIKKLTDIHTLAKGEWKLVLDSDMLFWHQPQELINWLQAPDRPIYMLDCVESYGYSHQLMTKLSGTIIPPLLNVGVIGLRSSDTAWNKIEAWIPELEHIEGASYYLEQALTAMLIGDMPATVLSTEHYLVNPANQSVNDKTGALHHYVDLSKKAYFTYAWRNVFSK